MKNKLDKILGVVNQHEATGKAFFNRNSDDSMTIFVRDPRVWGGNPNSIPFERNNANENA